MTTDSRHALAVGLFTVVVVVTLGITFWAGRRRRAAADFYTGGRDFSPMQNGFAISGDYMSAASFLGITGLIALYGYDGLLYTVGFLVAWLLVLMLVAELVRNCGRYTLADVLALRMRRRPVRAAAGISSIVVSLLYLVAQMVGAGSLVSLLLGLNTAADRDWSIVGIGALMIVYVTVGGMTATTWIQIVKCVVLLLGTSLLTVMVMLRFHGDLGSLLRSAAAHSGYGQPLLRARPPLRRQRAQPAGLRQPRPGAGAGHRRAAAHTVAVLHRAHGPRRPAFDDVGDRTGRQLLPDDDRAGARGRRAGRHRRRPLRQRGRQHGGADAGAGARRRGREHVGGTVLFAVISAVAFATILAVVAGLTLASSAAFAHDLWARAFRRREEETPTEQQEVVVARVAAVVFGAVAIVLSLYAQKLNVAFLVGIAFAVAASANVPALLFNLFWRRFSTRGATWAIYGGLVPALVLVVFSPVVSGNAAAIFPGVDFHWFPLENPGVVSIPCGFFFGWLGTVTSGGAGDPDAYAELEVRALTGAGAV